MIETLRVERHERAELATFIPFAMLELSIILFVLCGLLDLCHLNWLMVM